MENYLHEAFQAFKALDEDVFPATADGEEALKKFLDGDNLEDIEVIIDPDAETEDELKQSYVGDVIFKCPICQSMIYKKPEDVNIDEDQGLANIEEECPYCQTAGGFEIVGQVSEYCPECEHHDDEAEDKVEEKEDVEVELKENLEDILSETTTEFKRRGYDVEDIEVKNEIEAAAEYIKMTRDVTGNYTAKEWFKDTLSNYPEELAGLKKIAISEDADQLGAGLSRYQKWVDYDMKRYGKISTKMAKEKDGKDLTEAVDSVKVTTEDQEVTVEADGDETEVKVKPRESEEADVTSEVIEPVDEETKDELMADDDVKDYDDNYEDGYEDVSIEEFDEESFDELEEKYLKNIYENVTAYKTIKGSVDGDKIILEGIITFNSGKQKKTTSIFESHSITKRGKIKLLGENKNITTNKKAFTITGSLKGNKLITESLTYNYGVRDETGKATRLYGTVRK